MLKRILLCLCLLIPSFCFAQNDTTQYFDSKWLISDKQHAMYYRVFTKANDLYKVEDFKIDGKLMVSGFTDTVDIDISYNRQGRYTYYTPAGNKVKEGDFKDGLYYGQWQHYYKATGNLEKKVAYVNGQMVHATEYSDTTGTVTSEMSYKQGKMDSLTQYRYHPNGKLRSVTVSIGQKTEKMTCYSLTGEDTSCETAKSSTVYQFVEQMPSPPYNMMEYLSNNITYPEKARLKGLHGRVAISFTVMDDGSIEDVAVAQPVSPDIDEEALRVISTMPKWRPGRQNGKPVKVMYTQPISFKLE